MSGPDRVILEDDDPNFTEQDNNGENNEPIIGNDSLQPDSARPAPNSPLHDDETFPTPSNISERMAFELCRAAIQRYELYETCLNLTARNTEDYVRSCVEDIKVTVIVCHLFTLHYYIQATTIVPCYAKRQQSSTNIHNKMHE